MTDTNAHKLHNKVVRVGNITEIIFDGYNLYAEQGHFFPKAEPVAHIAASALHLIDYNALIQPEPCSFKHSLKIPTIYICA